MKNFIAFFLIAIIFISCRDDKIIKNYYSNGVLKLEVQVDENGIQNGYYKEYYNTGELFKKMKYFQGNIVDTVFFYHKNGRVKEKGILKDNKIKVNWWLSYERSGKLKSKIQYKVINDSILSNQVFYYQTNGSIDKESSSFFSIQLPDTIKLGKNIGQFYYNSSHNKATSRILDVIIENKYSDLETKLDTFGDTPNKTWFGVYAHKTGVKNIKGQILETLFYKTKVGIDSFNLKIETHKKYFEKKVFVKDTTAMILFIKQPNKLYNKHIV